VVKKTHTGDEPKWHLTEGAMKCLGATCDVGSAAETQGIFHIEKHNPTFHGTSVQKHLFSLKTEKAKHGKEQCLQQLFKENSGISGLLTP